jgi:hypothetical protein
LVSHPFAKNAKGWGTRPAAPQETELRSFFNDFHPIEMIPTHTNMGAFRLKLE